MDKTKLNELLDSIYELEGLVHLALTRDDNPDRLPLLIKMKGEAMAKLASGLSSGEPVKDETQAETYVLETETRQDVMPEELIPAEKMPMGDMPIEDTPMADDLPIEDMPIEEDMQSVVESVFSALPEKKPSPVSLGKTIPAVEKPLPSSEKEPRGRLVFSINDRYRFKRELFNNSDVDFNNTLAIVASMENYDEAEDYFLGELQWDSKQGDVADFLSVIKRYFKE